MVRSTVSLTRAHSVKHFPLLTLRRACEKYGLFKFSRNVASTIAAATQSKFWGATPTECQLREQIGTSRFVRVGAASNKQQTNRREN
jgi:hypothetical protein